MNKLFICMMVIMTLAACQPAGDSSGASGDGSDVVAVVAALPDGDVDRGAEIFRESMNGAPTCVQCHVLDGETTGLGPTLLGYATVAGERVEGQSAEVYTYNAILRPASYVVEGYANVMYGTYANHLEDQDIADLIAYLLTLEGAA